MRDVNYQSFLIKYAEIGLKGKNRHHFEKALAVQIRHALKRAEGAFAVRRANGRIYVDVAGDYDYDAAVFALRTVFGISGISPIYQTADEGFERLTEFVVRYVGDILASTESFTSGKAGPPATFKVAARRSRKNYPLDSMQINARLGAVILAAYPSLRVDVHDPDMTVNVEVRERIYVYSATIAGPGGLPVGTGGKAMLLLSGGIDSPVAGYMVAKRGVKIDAVYFHAPPYTGERAKQKVIDLARAISHYTGPIYLHIINFTAIQLAIYDNCPHEMLTVIMRRHMMRLAEQIAVETGSSALVTGESIGQVASQTLKALAATDEVCRLPVFRPLIGFDKMEIVKLAERIGTYETSILPFEDCCTIFVAKHPAINPDIARVKHHESSLAGQGDDLMAAALAAKELVIIRDGHTA